MRVLILASAVGNFGEGSTGGVSRYAEAMVRALGDAGIETHLLAPEGSQVPPWISATGVGGAFQMSAATAAQDAHPVPPGSLLGNMVKLAFETRDGYDRIINLNHDYLPVFSTPFFDGKLRHIPNLSASDEATDHLIQEMCRQYPTLFAAISQFQKNKLRLKGTAILSFGLERNAQAGNEARGDHLCWAGRITPEKGLEFAAEIAKRGGRKLMVAGHVEDAEYFQVIQTQYADDLIFKGYLDFASLQEMIASATGMLQTQSWEEALGLTTIEALASGTPVIAFDRGANGEIIADGLNGFMIQHGDIEAASAAAAKISTLDRLALFDDFDARFSLPAFRKRLLDWLN